MGTFTLNVIVSEDISKSKEVNQQSWLPHWILTPRSVRSKPQKTRSGMGSWEIEGIDLLTYVRISPETATGKSLQASGNTSRLSLYRYKEKQD